ncbi:MAG: hypothetical protein ACOX76_09015 [Lachnospiraceae bacterium]
MTTQNHTLRPGTSPDIKYKDTVFRKLFSDPARLLELYNAMNKSNYTDSSELEINTLDNAVYLGMKNDVSFIFHNELWLYEHQSTVNPNMPLRDLIYAADILASKFYDKSVYSSVQIKIPSPRFIVFYNGSRNVPEQYMYRLSDAYYQNNNGEAPFCEPFLELKVLVININGCYNEDIKRSCKTLSDYQTYVSLVRAYSATMPIEKAVSTAIEECIGNNVLREFLEKERAVVMSLSVFEFNKEREFKIVREDEREEGIRIGMERGLQQGMERGLQQGMERGLQQGMERGLQQGMERGITAYFNQAVKYGASTEDAISDAAIEFNVTEEYIKNIIEDTESH